MTKKKEGLSKEDLEEIIKDIEKIYAEAGRDIETATLFDEEHEDGELLIDNRDPKTLH